MSALRLTVSISSPRLVRPFIIATGARTHQPYLSVHLSGGSFAGRGAATGISYLGANPQTLQADIEAVRSDIEAGITRDTLGHLLPAGGARAALDAALWELEASRSGRTVAELLNIDPQPIPSAFTIVLDTPEAMAAQARAESGRPLLKVKLGGTVEEEEQRMRAVALTAPQARKVIDANAAWTADQLMRLAPVAAELGYELLEQPLPMGCEADSRSCAALVKASASIPLCADESLQTQDDLVSLNGLYQAVNIKLDKCGGLTAALALRDAAKAQGMKIFIGCMLAPTLAIAPAHLLAQGADYADLDGPFWFDNEPAQLTEAGLFAPITPSIWGAGKRRANDQA